jgi:ABC-type glycerol-3-phosphate transport system substrate-binding protein
LECVYGGKPYSLKYSMNVNGVWYNQALFDE